MPSQDALEFLVNKEQLPSEWSAAEWAAQEADFSTRSFFSSRVENARFLDRAQGLIFDYMAKVRDEVTTPDGRKTTALRVSGRAHFVVLMRDFMISEGMANESEFKNVNQKDVRDLRSLARLNLIFDTTVRQSYGHSQWKQGMTPAVLKAFPAARLIRDMTVKVPRPRHEANLGQVRLKTDPWWAEYINDPKIGGFGVPWGPYGFNSGVTQEGVSKAEWEKIKPTVEPPPTDTSPTGMNDGLSASTITLSPEMKRKLIEELNASSLERSKRPTIEQVARDAAAGARRDALERGLADAQKRGDSAKADKYQKAIDGLQGPDQGAWVHDEGDRIVLISGLSQRLSKIQKSDPNPSEKAAIAQKIFESVDRKSAEPKTRNEVKKGVNRSRHLLSDDLILTPEESLIMKSPMEILLVHTPEGRLKSVTLGGAHDVMIPSEIPQGSILSHNHPGGIGPSATDLNYVLENSGNTLRIVSESNSGTELYRLKTLKNPNADEIRDIVEKYEMVAKTQGDHRVARIEALSLILEEFGDILSAELESVR